MQKFVQNGETWRNIQILPYIALQQGRMVGQLIYDFRRRQAVIPKLLLKIAVARASHP
jgi:hypothetical protein